jgi:two-component system sensor histidine kinase UhpB
MFNRLSLQLRLSLILSALLGLVLIGSAVTIVVLSQEQLIDEHQAAVSLARQFADSLNRTLQDRPDAEDELQSLVETFPSLEPGRLGFLPEGRPLNVPDLFRSLAGTPDWFTRLVMPEAPIQRFPVLVAQRKIGDVVFVPDLSLDVLEKWVAFLMSLLIGVALICAVSLVTYFTVRRTLRPVRQLENSIVGLRSGHYGMRVVFDGPPELNRSFAELNELSDRLHQLSVENRDLLRQLVSVQDEERRDLSRELHDELGPQLFAIRANAASLAGTNGNELEAGLQRLAEAVEGLQKSNRRILDRLRPMHLQELGLLKSVEGLVRDAREQKPAAHFAMNFDGVLEQADPVVQRTIYRFMQEAITNVLRHAEASEISVSGTRLDAHARIEVVDNGVGLAADYMPGRGITGMRERVRALGGTFSLVRQNGRTRVFASLPLEQPR